MTDQLAAINAALEAARGAASASVPTLATAPSTTVTTTAPLAGGRAVTMRQMIEESTMSVDAYLKAEKAGFLIGDDKKNYVDTIDVEFRFSQVKVFYGIRYGASPTKYERSYDRILNARNKRPWADCVAEGMRMDPKCRGDYRGVDLPFTVVNDVIGKDGKTVLIGAGKTLGWTSSVTNWKQWLEFSAPYYKLMDNGAIAEDALVRGKIVHELGENKDFTWGLVTFGDFAFADVGGVTEQAQAA
jgi:hypothetical protein